ENTPYLARGERVTQGGNGEKVCCADAVHPSRRHPLEERCGVTCLGCTSRQELSATAGLLGLARADDAAVAARDRTAVQVSANHLGRPSTTWWWTAHRSYAAFVNFLSSSSNDPGDLVWFRNRTGARV